MVTHALNPELSAQEREECKREVKERVVAEAAERIASDFVPGELLIGFKSGLGDNQVAFQTAKEVLQGYTVASVELREGWVKVRFQQPQGLSEPELRRLTADAVAEARESEFVAWAEPNYIAEASDVSWGLQAIEAPLAQTVVRCDQSIGIAVVDTGISQHAEFARLIHLYDYANDDPDATDDHGHGTHVASTAGGLTVGVCPGAALYAVKVLDEHGSGDYDRVAQGILRAAQEQDVRVINLSLGGGNPSSVLRSALGEASSAGKIIFMASGNRLGPKPDYPGAYADDFALSMAIGAVDRDWRLTVFSSRFANLLHAGVAPGVDVPGAAFNDPQGYFEFSGTSMATPHWAGGAALLWSSNAGMTADQVLTYLRSSAVALGDSQDYGVGALNIAAAVKYAIGADYDLPPFVAWPLPWPSSTMVGEAIEVMALIPDLDGGPLTVGATVVTPSGVSSTHRMIPHDGRLWAAPFIPGEEGKYTFTVTVSDDTWKRLSPAMDFYVVPADGARGWSQHGNGPAGGSFAPYEIDLASHEQMYATGDNISAGNDLSVVGVYGRADVPAAVRIVSFPPCPYGNDFGERWFFNPYKGIHYASNPEESLELSCLDGIGMFGETAASNGTFFTYDQGTSESPPSRLQSFDPWGRLFWLTQLNYHGFGPVRLAGDGLYVVHGPYDGLHKVDARTGQRKWFFLPRNQKSMYVPPAVDLDKGLVLAIATDRLYALNDLDGSVKWEYQCPSGSNGRSLPAIVKDVLLHCGDGGVLHALEFTNSTRRLIWEKNLGNGSYCDSTPAVLGEEYVVQYVSRYPGPNLLYVLSLQTGEILAQIGVVKYGSAWASPIVVGRDLIFLADYDGFLRAYRIEYANNRPAGLTKVWEDEIDPYNISNWQVSAFVEQGVGGQKYLILPVSSNNGYFEGHRFKITGVFLQNPVYLPLILR